MSAVSRFFFGVRIDVRKNVQSSSYIHVQRYQYRQRQIVERQATNSQHLFASVNRLFYSDYVGGIRSHATTLEQPDARHQFD